MLEDILYNLKPVLKQIVGEVEIEKNIISCIVNKLKTKKEIYAWTDGSMMKGRNGHGYIILPERTLIKKYITGYGRSLRGTIDSSLRSEHCGVLAVLIMIESIEKAYGIEHSGKVTIYTDSMTVVQRIKEETREMNFANTDYDLWSMSMSILGKIKTSVRIEHVKAHQDEKVGPLTFEQYYNVTILQCKGRSAGKKRV